MNINDKNIIKWLKWAHWLGVLAVLSGTWLLFMTEQSQQIKEMVSIAILIGGGLVSMSPYPVVLFIQWMHNQDQSSK